MLLGFFDGTGLINDVDDLAMCEDTVRWKIIHNGWLLGNSSKSGDHFRALYAFWDIVYNVHPMFMVCRGWMYDFGLNVAGKFSELDDIRRIVVNVVNHIDEMTDAILDLTHFFGSTDKGHDLEGPYRVGQSMGSLVFYTVAKENSDPFYDPAASMDLGPLPWQVITDLVDEANKEKEARQAAKAAEEAAAAEEN